MLARSIRYEVFLLPWNASAYCVKRVTNVNAAIEKFLFFVAQGVVQDLGIVSLVPMESDKVCISFLKIHCQVVG